MKGDSKTHKLIKAPNKIFKLLTQSSSPKSPFILPLLSLIYQFVNLSKNDNNSFVTVYNL